MRVHLMSAGRLRYHAPGAKTPKTPMFRLTFDDGGAYALLDRLRSVGVDDVMKTARRIFGSPRANDHIELLVNQLCNHRRCCGGLICRITIGHHCRNGSINTTRVT